MKKLFKASVLLGIQIPDGCNVLIHVSLDSRHVKRARGGVVLSPSSPAAFSTVSHMRLEICTRLGENSTR